MVAMGKTKKFEKLASGGDGPRDFKKGGKFDPDAGGAYKKGGKVKKMKRASGGGVANAGGVYSAAFKG
jgi:hypothetical protein